jgi:hypothetical protein
MNSLMDALQQFSSAIAATYPTQASPAPAAPKPSMPVEDSETLTGWIRNFSNGVQASAVGSSQEEAV